MPYPLLISLREAKTACYVVGTDSDERIDGIRKDAQKIIIDYCKVADDAYDVDLPAQVKRAMLMVTQNLFTGEEPLSDAVKSILERSRDPTLA